MIRLKKAAAENLARAIMENHDRIEDGIVIDEARGPGFHTLHISLINGLQIGRVEVES